MEEIIRPDPRTGYFNLTPADIGKKVALGTDPTVKDRLWDNKKDMIWTVIDVLPYGPAVLLLDESINSLDFYLTYNLSEYDKRHYDDDRFEFKEYHKKDKKYEFLYDKKKGIIEIINNFFKSVFTSLERDMIEPPSEWEKTKLCTLDKGEVAKYKNYVFEKRDHYDCEYLVLSDRIVYYCIYKDGRVSKLEHYDLERFRPAISIYSEKEVERKRKNREEAERMRREAERIQAENARKQRELEEAARKRREENERLALIADWKLNGRCQHCGGKFGLIKKVCKKCGKPKDY